MFTFLRVAREPKQARWLYTVLVCSLLLQILVPPQVSFAAPVPAKSLPFTAQTLSQPSIVATPDPVPTPEDVVVAPPPPDANVLQTITPTLPVYLNIALDRAVMTVDETALVTVSLYSAVDLTKNS